MTPRLKCVGNFKKVGRWSSSGTRRAVTRLARVSMFNCLRGKLSLLDLCSPHSIVKMWLKTLATAAALFSQLVGAQLRLPSPPYLPPDRNAGAVASTGGFPNPQWMTLLGNLLYFYDEQRSGTLPSTNRVPWRNASLIYEGRDQGIDLSGASDFLQSTSRR